MPGVLDAQLHAVRNNCTTIGLHDACLGGRHPQNLSGVAPFQAAGGANHIFRIKVGSVHCDLQSGCTKARSEVHRDGDWHCAVHVWNALSVMIIILNVQTGRTKARSKVHRDGDRHCAHLCSTLSTVNWVIASSPTCRQGAPRHAARCTGTATGTARCTCGSSACRRGSWCCSGGRPPRTRGQTCWTSPPPARDLIHPAVYCLC